jgi:hypothetical protein
LKQALYPEPTVECYLAERKLHGTAHTSGTYIRGRR